MLSNSDHYNLNSICNKGRRSHGWKFLWHGGDHTGTVFQVTSHSGLPLACLSVRYNQIMVDTIANMDADKVHVFKNWEQAYQRLEELCNNAATTAE